jgi:multidrug transporter EmrE-like cation transporter
MRMTLERGAMVPRRPKQWRLWEEREQTKPREKRRMTVFMLVLNVVLNVLASVFIKIGMRGASGEMGGAVLHMLRAWQIYAAVACFGGGFVTYSLLLARMSLSVVYPLMMGSIAAGISLAAVFCFGETFSLVKGVGLMLVVAGVWCLTR